MCPVCGDQTIRRSGRALLTCGSAACATELRARRVRGRSYGPSPNPKPRLITAGYNAVHHRARRALKAQGRLACEVADHTCQGRIEVALRWHLDPALIVVDEHDRPYYTGLDTEAAYRPLCRSHHAREGSAHTALRRVQIILGEEFADEPWRERLWDRLVDRMTEPTRGATL